MVYKSPISLMDLDVEDMYPKDLVGKKIRALEILAFEFPKEDSPARLFKCKCECGRIVYKNKGYLAAAQTGNHHGSCGCRKEISIQRVEKERLTKAQAEVGKKYNQLLILLVAKKDDKSNTHFICRCDCGRKTIVVGYALKNGNTKTCGCEIGKKYSLESN